MNRILLIFISCFCFSLSYAQLTEKELNDFINKSTEQELVLESSLYITQGAFYNAEKITDKLLTLKPESSNYNYRKGYLILASRGDFAAATPYLEKAVKDIDKNYDMNSANEKSASPDALYNLACCYHAAARLDEAMKLFNDYMATSSKKGVLVELSKLKIKQCKVAQELMANPNPNMSVKNVGSVVNSPFPDYAAIVALDGSALFFTSRRPWEDGSSDPYIDRLNNLHPEDVYVSYLDSTDNWTTPSRLNFCINSSNEATVAVNTDERRVYTYKDITGGGDIYYSDFSNNKFNEIVYLNNQDINSKYWEPHATVSPHGGMITYFVSDRPGGLGGRDIYQVLRNPDGTMGKPENLGPNVNTPYDEDAPFVSADGKHLYFSSNGPKSMGGFDILMSNKNEKKSGWGESVNLGYPINSCGDDLYYSATIEGYKGYFTSFRTDGSGEKDIYEVTNNYLGVKDIVFLKEKFNTVDNKRLPEDVGITFRCMDCEERHQETVYPRMRDKLLLTSLIPCKSYEIIYHYGADKKEMYRDTVKTACGKYYAEVQKEFRLDVDKMTLVPVVTKDSIVELPEVPVSDYKSLELKYFFKYDDNKMSMRSRDLKRFAKEVEKQLEEGEESITIQVASSASKVPTRKFESNQALANLRAENLKYDIITYFQEKTKIGNRINVVIVSAKVDGPDYENDRNNKEKYRPYQFVILKTE